MLRKKKSQIFGSSDYISYTTSRKFQGTILKALSNKVQYFKGETVNFRNINHILLIK